MRFTAWLTRTFPIWSPTDYSAMTDSFSQLKVLLLQARNTEDMVIQEQECFLERCRLRPDQLDSLNLPLMAELPDVSLLDAYDAFFIGGAGEYSVTKDYPWMPFALDLIRHAHASHLPTFGSCWGHQLIARALGGEVIHDPERAELGCHNINLTEAGKHDELLAPFPDSFLANMGHHDRVYVLPEGAIELADNHFQSNEAFRIKDRPMYGTQFHSELDKRREAERLVKYRSFYINELHSEEVFQEVLNSLQETTEVDHLMYDFLKRFAVK